MPSRCVVQDCNNKSKPKEGISLHISSTNKTKCAKWKKFVLLHRRNFNPEDRFVICSKHFEQSCFSRLHHEEGSLRRLLPGSIPTIWKTEDGEQINSARDRRMVSCGNLYEIYISYCLVLSGIHCQSKIII